jgi:hypothetical protein
MITEFVRESAIGSELSGRVPERKPTLRWFAAVMHGFEKTVGPAIIEIGDSSPSKKASYLSS